MANHKRGRAKNQRAGCLLCKPHKANGADRRTRSEMVAADDAEQQVSDYRGDSGFDDATFDWLFDDDDPNTPERYWSDWLNGREDAA